MQPFPNIDADTLGQLRAFAGSFWTDRFGQKEQVDILISLAVRNRVMGLFRSSAYNLMGQDVLARIEKYEVMQFDPQSVKVTNQLLYDDPDRALNYGDLTTTFDAYDAGGVTYYIIPITTHVPRVIQAGQITLLLGVDFFRSGCWLFFRQDPRLLFTNGYISMPVAERVNYKPILTFLLRAMVGQNSQYLTQYYKGHQTPGAFRLALAAVGGLQITHYDQKLIYALPRGCETVYVFEQETLRVDYDHTPLVPGTTYPADTIIGNGVQIYYNQGTTTAWWRQADWGPGILLDPLLPQFKGLALLDRSAVAYGAGSDVGDVNGSKQHVRIKLSDDFDAEAPYWDWVAQRETESGIYLNSVIGLSDNGNAFATMRANLAAARAFDAEVGQPPEQPDLEALPGVKRVNALDVFFTNVLDKTGLVIVVQRDQIKNLAFFYRFLQREMMVGVVPIVLSQGPPLEVESLAVGSTINIGEGVVQFGPLSSQSVLEQVNLTSLVNDTPRIKSKPQIYDQSIQV